MNDSPLRFWRRTRSRTTNGDSTCCPSARSRTNALVQDAISSDVCDMRPESIARMPDDFAPLLNAESLAKSLQSPRIAELRDGVLVRVEARDPERLLAREGRLPAHAHHVLAAVAIVDPAVHRRGLELLVEQAGLGYRDDWREHLADPDVAQARDVRPHAMTGLE